MELYPILNIQKGVTAVIGSGGKSTLLHTLAGELSGRVLLCTSTHFLAYDDLPLLTDPTADDLRRAFAEHRVVCAARRSPEGKLVDCGLPYEQLAELADYVLVEADGSRRLPLKAHAGHEPVIPPNARRTVYVVGADGFGHPIREVCHRPERYAALCGAAEDDIVTPTLEAAVLHAEGYDTGWVYINKVETPSDWANAEALAALLPGKAVAGSLWERRYRIL